MSTPERHFTDEELISMSRAGLPGERLFEVSNHLGECASCAARSRQLVDLDRMAIGMQRDLEDVEHPAQERLIAFVDGDAVSADSQWIEMHLATCASCAAEVADLRAEERARAVASPARSWMPLAAGIVLVTGMAAGLYWLRPTSPGPPEHGTVIRPAAHTDASLELERTVLSAGHIDRPSAIGELRRAGQAERGGPSPTERRLDPSGVVVESDRPELTWTAVNGAHYRVGVFAGDEPVARSGRLDEARWQPATALQRGKTYLWQVDVIRPDGTTIVIPTPSAPEALFRVADAATIHDLEGARKAHPGDHLLLGILYARAGLRREAIAELDAHLAQNPGDTRAASVADSIRRW